MMLHAPRATPETEQNSSARQEAPSVKSNHTSSPTDWCRHLRTFGILLLIPSAICAAQHSVPSDLRHNTPVPVAQEKPLQIVRPMERQERPWRGAPWLGNFGQVAEDGALAPEPLPFSTKPQQSTSATLRVSGWWTIEVKNADGSTALRREVENTFNANPMIVYLLTGKAVPGEASIRFGTGNGNSDDPLDPTNFTNSPCTGSSGCLMSEVAGGYFNTLPQCTQNPGSCSSNLAPSVVTVTVVINDGHGVPFSANVPAVELNGQITAQTSSTIGYLETEWLTCSEAAITSTSPVTGVNPASCLSSPGPTAGLTTMTYLELGNPISISAGQVISIKTDISFSPFPPA